MDQRNSELPPLEDEAFEVKMRVFLFDMSSRFSMTHTHRNDICNIISTIIIQCVLVLVSVYAFVDMMVCTI